MWCEACSGSSVVCTALLIIGTVVATASCTGDELVVLPSATDAGTDVGTVVDAVADASVVDARPIPKLCILPSGYQAPFDPTEWYDARDARITTAESVAKWSPLGPSKAILNALSLIHI